MIAIGIRRGSHEPEQFDVPKPEPGEGQVLVRTLRVGICGTDREIIESGTPHVPEGSEFLVLGHEALGRVEAVGRGVEGVAAGQLVVPSVRRSLTGDHACRADLLEQGEYTERGIERQHGFAQELWVERPEYLTHVPDALEPIAVLAEPFSVVEKAINEALLLQRARLGDACPEAARVRALVVGPGPVGFAAAFACMARGFRVSIAGHDDPETEKVAFIRSLGLEYVNTEEVDFGDLAERGTRWDLMVEAAGVGWLVFEIVKALAPRGALALTGISPEYEKTPVDANRFLTETVMDNRLVLGSVNAAMSDFRDAITHLGWAHENHPDQIRQLLTGRYPARDFAEAYADVVDRKRKPNAIKTVIEFE
jgi:threonine dehydrogenase-like Zn-dependent dehydrogenase